MGLRPAAKPDTEQPSSIVGLFRRLIDPPLQPGDDLRTLGDRWLVLLGSPAQAASAERLWHAALAKKEDPIDVQVHMFEIDAKAFAPLQEKLVAVQREQGMAFEGMLEKDAASAFRAALAKAATQQLDAPRLCMNPLQRGTMSMVKQTSYVKDFTVTRTGDTLVADPVVDVVQDGNITDVIATWLPDGLLGMSCDVTFQELQQPIPQFETTLGPGLPPVKIQLPRVTGVRLRQTAVLGKDSMVVLAAQRASGEWLCATVQAGPLPK